MRPIETIDGKLVTEEMIEKWEQAAEAEGDTWPEGWTNWGPVVVGRPPMSPEGSAVLSVKVPAALKRNLQDEAEAAGVSTSEYIRDILATRKIA